MYAPRSESPPRPREAQRRAVVEADHTVETTSDVYRRTRRRVVVRRAGLSGDIAEAVALEARRRAALHDAVQE